MDAYVLSVPDVTELLHPTFRKYSWIQYQLGLGLRHGIG